MDDGVVKFTRRSEFTHLAGSLKLSETIQKLPDVRILYGYAGDDGFLVEAAVKAGARGIVYAGMGNGSLPAPVEEKLAQAVKDGVTVVRSTRGYAGQVTYAEHSYEEAKILRSESLNPQKARILLQLALQQKLKNDEIQDWFNRF